jgi:hypothetical protein
MCTRAGPGFEEQPVYPAASVRNFLSGALIAQIASADRLAANTRVNSPVELCLPKTISGMTRASIRFPAKQGQARGSRLWRDFAAIRSIHP